LGYGIIGSLGTSDGSAMLHQFSGESFPFFIGEGGIGHSPESFAYDKVTLIRCHGVAHPCLESCGRYNAANTRGFVMRLFYFLGSSNSIGFPAGSSSRICFPPLPCTISFLKLAPFLLSFSTVAVKSSISI